MEFTYTAVTKDGRKETSSIQAPNIAIAGHLLKEQGLLPTDIHEQSKQSITNYLSSVSTIPLAEKINFIQNLSIMLKAGIAISRGLQIIVKQTKNQKFKNILLEVYNQVEQGKGLSEALEKFANIFPPIVISMVKVGEVSGSLDKSLEYLSLQLQREADLKSKVRGAMIYPCVILSALVIIGILMSIFVLPSLTSIFATQGISLPLMTRIVIDISNTMSQHTALVLSCMVGFIAIVIAYSKTKFGQRSFDFATLHIMIISMVSKKLNLARFARILSSLLKSGIPIVQGLEVSGNSLGNVYFKELVLKAAEDVRLGKQLADSLGKDPSLFPVLVAQMIEVGEESGTVQEILEQLATHYEADVDDMLKNLTSVIEPLLILFIGAVVGFLALALITPIYSIYQSSS
jgi:type IV pilus assembly protein PilC